LFAINGSLEPSNYVIQEGDEIETRNFYTIGQLAEFMDVRIDEEAGIILNGKPADMGSLNKFRTGNIDAIDLEGNGGGCIFI